MLVAVVVVLVAVFTPVVAVLACELNSTDVAEPDKKLVAADDDDDEEEAVDVLDEVDGDFD